MSSISTSKPEWLIPAVDRFNSLLACKILVTADFDLAAVSDGTSGCHFKDAAFVGVSNDARNLLGPKLNTILAQIIDCDAIAEAVKLGKFVVKHKTQATFDYVNINLEAVRATSSAETIAVLEKCIELRSCDQWTRTVFGKAVVVRARKTLRAKDANETAIQEYLISDAKKQHPSGCAGYDGEISEAVRRFELRFRHMPITHFVPMTLYAIHKSYNGSLFTYLNVTRISVSGDDLKPLLALRKAYSLCFQHTGEGKYQYVDSPTISESYHVSQIFEGESKVVTGQEGEGLCSADDDVWLAAIKENFGMLLLCYAFNHAGYPAGIDFTDNQTKSAFEAISGRSAGNFTRAKADEILNSFDFRGGATNPALVDLYDMATIDRPGFGTGSVKYIENIDDHFAYAEPTKAVGLNFHHIRTGTGQQVVKEVNDMNMAHRDAPPLGTKLVISGAFALPFTSGKGLNTVLDIKAEGPVPEHAVILNYSMLSDTRIFTR